MPNLKSVLLLRRIRQITMYMARKTVKGTTHYIIRESYENGECLQSRDLFYLGTNPGNYIIYPGGNSYYFDEIIEEKLQASGVSPENEELEDIFWPFIRPDIKRAIQHFRGRSRRNEDQAVCGTKFHLFDKRRIHYLRCGRMDQGKIGRVSPKLFNILSGKSRDEIEQYFMISEQVLRNHEIKSYIFVIFDLQKHFFQSFAKSIPQALDQNLVDEYFIKEVCEMNKDENFWAGTTMEKKLNEYLVRYLTIFFDNDYGRSSFMEDIFEDWMNSRRNFIPPKKRNVTMDEASTVFGITETELRKMTRLELSRLYRQKAHKLHPDKGGDQEAFIHLTEVYQGLKERKK